MEVLSPVSCWGILMDLLTTSLREVMRGVKVFELHRMTGGLDQVNLLDLNV